MKELENMNIITVNDEQYVKKEAVENLIHKVKKQKGVKPKFALTDPAHVLAIASTKVSHDYLLVDISTDLLRRALRIFKQVDKDFVTLGIKDNFPLVMGEYEDNIIKGVIIAPRIDEEAKNRKK